MDAQVCADLGIHLRDSTTILAEAKPGGSMSSNIHAKFDRNTYRSMFERNIGERVSRPFLVEQRSYGSQIAQGRIILGTSDECGALDIGDGRAKDPNRSSLLE